MKTIKFVFNPKIVLLLLPFFLFSCSVEEQEVVTEEVSEIEEADLATRRVSSFEGKTYYIKNVNSGKYLDVAAFSNSNGANIHQWSFTGAINQQWKVISLGNNKVRFKSLQSGKSLDVDLSQTNNGRNIEQNAYAGLASQKWEIFSAGSGQYYIINENSGKAVDVAGYSTSNGGNIHQWTYNNTTNQKWIFEEVGGGNDDGTAAGVLGGLQNWKLNAYSGTLNVNNSNNGLSYVDNASKNDNNSWFYDANGWAYFKTYPGNPRSSSNTSNPRTELREMTSNGSTEILWDGTTGTEHSMKWTVRVDDLPPSGKVCFGQIHAESGSPFDDVIRIQVQGDAGQNSGEVDLRINGYASEELLGGGVTISNFTFNMDTSYSFELTMKNKIVRLYALNSSGSRTSTLFTSGSINSDANYFKAGSYLQSTKSSHYGSSVYGLVGIKSLSVSH